mgnify:CR=1 FL=1
MRGERGMSDVVETTSDKDGGREEGGGAEGAIILLFHRGRTPRWR